MRERTVKKRIFISNALMVVVTLAVFLIVNIVFVKLYAESVEREFLSSAEGFMDEEGLKNLLKDFTLQRKEFVLLFSADGVLCMAVLLIVSQLFTKNLTDHIMDPLSRLEKGAERIQNHDLSEDISYQGELEFERVCGAFNTMQKHILTEREKNRKYERARADMITGISHDLRTPLTAVRGTIKGLLDGVAATPEKQKKFLEAAFRRTGEMDTLLNQLFYLSRLETGNLPISPQTVRLRDFIESYVRAKQEFLERGSEELLFEHDGSAAEVSVDPEQLGRVFENLLENSRKYGETRPLTMKITLAENKKGARICFSDNGTGVPEGKMPYLFEEFYRGDEARNRKEGNGLGLYIVKCLIETMGGTVWAESGNGFAVYLELPKADGKESRNGQQADIDCGR